MTNNFLDCYLRVSSRSQQDEGHSLQTQRDIGKRVARRLKLKSRFHDEGVRSSTRTKQREVLDEIKLGIESEEIKNIWVIEYERLFRNIADSMLFQEYYLDEYEISFYSGESGEKLVFGKDTDNEIFAFKSLISHLESKKIRRRSIRGKRGRLDRDSQDKPIFLGGSPTFGYINQNKEWVINKEESKWVKWMFQSYAKGMSSKQIQIELDKNGVKPRRAKLWNLATIQKMLGNECYTGLKRWTDKELGKEWVYQIPQIVSVSLYQKVQKKLTENQKLKDNNKKHHFLLDGLLFCECGLKMGSESKERTYGKTEVYYCVSRGRRWRGEDVAECNNRKSLDKESTDREIVEFVKGIVGKSNTLKEQFKTDVLSTKLKDSKQLKEDRKRLERKVKKIQKDIEQSVENISGVEFERIQETMEDKVAESVLKLLYERKDALETSYKEVFQEIENLDERETWLDWLGKYGEDLQLKTSTETKKRDFLEGLIKRITVKVVNGKDRDGKQVQIGEKFNILFKMKIVDDRVEYEDETKKSLGYEIVGGKQRKTTPMMDVSVGSGRPKKKANQKTTVLTYSVTVE